MRTTDILKAKSLLGSDADLIDWDAVLDSTLTLSENLDELRSIIAPFRTRKAAYLEGFDSPRAIKQVTLISDREVTEEDLKVYYEESGILVLECEEIEKDQIQVEHKLLLGLP